MSPSRKTRRQVSVRGLTHQRLEEHCKATGRSIAGFVEELVNAKLDAENVPVPTSVAPPRPRARKKTVDHGQYFTF